MFLAYAGMILIKTSTCIKLSTAHNEGRACDYWLYLASIIRIPDVRSVMFGALMTSPRLDSESMSG